LKDLSKKQHGNKGEAVINLTNKNNKISLYKGYSAFNNKNNKAIKTKNPLYAGFLLPAI